MIKVSDGKLAQAVFYTPQSKAKHHTAGDNESVPSDIQPFNSEKIFYCISVQILVPSLFSVYPQLGVLSQLILIVLMYLGRVGGLTLIYAAISNKNQSGAKLPLENITVG